MSLEERFNKKNSELQQKIEVEIVKVKEGQSKRNMVQLQTILIEASSRQRNVTLSYPRIIIDSWDYSDQLGVELVELAELYKKI